MSMLTRLWCTSILFNTYWVRPPLLQESEGSNIHTLINCRFDGSFTQAGRKVGWSALSIESPNQRLTTQTPCFLR